MRHLLKVFLKSCYRIIFSPGEFYSETANSATYQDGLMFGGLSSFLTALSIGLWFTYTGSIFGFASAGGFRELLFFTAVAFPSTLLVLFFSAYSTKIGLKIMGEDTEWRDSFAAYVYSLPVFFTLFQIPILNIFLPFYVTYVQIRGISELTDSSMLKAAMGWTVQALILCFVLLIPLTYYSLKMFSQGL
jgi:hypothetical protein